MAMMKKGILTTLFVVSRLIVRAPKSQNSKFTLPWNMRKEVLITWFLLTQLITTLAQEQNVNAKQLERARLKYQLSVGPSVSKMQSNHKDFQKILERKVGYVIQGGISQYLGPRFDLHMFVGYFSKGNITRALTSDTNSTPPLTLETIEEESLNYMLLNLTPTYYIDKGCRLGISLGSYIGILVSDKLYSEQYANGILDYKHTVYNVLGYKTFDFGISSELSYQISLRRSHEALLKLRWDRGLFNVSPGGAAMYNQIFAVQVGVIL